MTNLNDKTVGGKLFTSLDDELAAKIGKDLIELFGLRVKANGRVDTAIGDKTPAGLARTVKRVFDETIDKVDLAAQDNLIARKGTSK
jgi:hypothetical protein